MQNRGGLTISEGYGLHVEFHIQMGYGRKRCPSGEVAPASHLCAAYTVDFKDRPTYTCELLSTESSCMARAGAWLLDSGIQQNSGGVSRYRRTDIAENLPVSTEITGYVVSALCYLFEQSGDQRYLEGAKRGADFLIDQAWDRALSSMPFELSPGGRYSYFFDTGIIARSLLFLYRLNPSERYLSAARDLGSAMERDFGSMSGAYHPIVLLPCKSPAPYETWWSKMPGAFQLKAALAWHELGTVTGEARFSALYEQLLSRSLRQYRETLDIERDEIRKMDRLHAWAYFLEGLQPVASRPEIAKLLEEALAEGETLREAIAPRFLRSDVCAQLLRVKLLGGGTPAPGEIERIEAFQYPEGDPVLAGGFAFGLRDGALTPHVNPVSTAFCLQALSFAGQAAGNGLDHANWRSLV